MLIGLCGKSGTGKSSLVKELEKLGYRRVITDTTRPPREGEKSGVDYFFDSDDLFDELEKDGEFVETTSYIVANGEVWRYGTTRGQLLECDDNAVIVLNPDGVKAFRKQGVPIQIVLLETNEDLILNRLKKRGDDIEEIERRMAADDEDFKDINTYIDFSVFNEHGTELESLAKTIIGLAESREQDE